MDESADKELGIKLGRVKNLMEKYISISLIEEDILSVFNNKENSDFFRERSYPRALSKGAGKDQTAIAKNISNLESITTASLFRYWHSFLQICRESNFPEKEIPTLDQVFNKKRAVIHALCDAKDHADFEQLLEEHANAFAIIYEFFSSPGRKERLSEELYQIIIELQNNKKIQEAVKVNRILRGKNKHE